MSDPRCRAVALLAVLWIGALAAVLLVGVRLSASVDLSLSHAELERVQARWLARAGVDQAMAVLADDLPDIDSHLDLWYREPGYFENVELASGTYSVTAPPGDRDDATVPRFGVTDLAGLLNLNAADSRQLQELPDVPSSFAPSVLDWRDRNSSTRTGGAERAHYAKLEFPYSPANKPFSTPLELRLVHGVDDALFFGEDTNLNGVLDPNENDGPASPPEDDADGKLNRGLAGLTTVYGYELNQTAAGLPRLNVTTARESVLRDRLRFTRALARGVANTRDRNRWDSVFDLLDARPDNTARDASEDEEELVSSITLDWLAENLDELTLTDDERLPAKVNVNTAPREVLLTLPQVTEDVAEQIISHRASDSGPFDTLGELRSSGVLNDRQFRAVAERLVVRSHVFQIDATGKSARGIRRRVVAAVDRGVAPMRVLYWREEP